MRDEYPLSEVAKKVLTAPICFGAARMRIEDWPRGELGRRSQEMLCRALNLGTTVAFVGAGASAGLARISHHRDR